MDSPRGSPWIPYGFTIGSPRDSRMDSLIHRGFHRIPREGFPTGGKAEPQSSSGWQNGIDLAGKTEGIYMNLHPPR